LLFEKITPKDKKLELIKKLLIIEGEKNYRNGYHIYNDNYQKRKRLFHPIILNAFFAIIMLRNLISFFIHENYYSIIIGDFLFNFEFKPQFILVFSIFCLITVLSQIASYFNQKDNKQFNQSKKSSKKNAPI
jgi:hypothetical protein